MNQVSKWGSGSSRIRSFLVIAVAFAAAAVLVFSGAISALAAPSSNRGSNYNHIDVKMSATYTVAIDGVSYVLKGTPVQDTLTVWIGDTEYVFDEAEDRSEDDHYEFNLNTSNVFGKITWASNNSSSDGYWKPTNVFFATKIELDKVYLVRHLSEDSIDRLISIGVIEVQANGSYWVSVDKQQYTGIQECTGGRGLRSDGNSGTPSGLDIVLSAQETGTAITKGKLALSKVIVDEEKNVLENDQTEFDFTVYSNAEGKYAQFDESNTYIGLGEIEDVVSVQGGGSVVLTGLPAGIYTITELQTNEGYIIGAVDGVVTDSYTKDYVIETKTDEDIPVATFTNVKLEDSTGISIRKISEGLDEGASYPNPQIIIYKVEGDSRTVVWEGDLDANGDTCYLNHMFSPGTYLVEEVNASVAGHGVFAVLQATEGIDVDGMSFVIDSSDMGKQVSLVLENTYAETTSVTAAKVWDDASNQDGLRTDITLQLWKQVGSANAIHVEGSDKTISQYAEGNALSVKWTNLPAMENGENIVYTVKEAAVPAGYTSLVTGDAASGFIVTNSHTPATIDIEGTKTWVDFTSLPSSVDILLYADGAYKDKVTVAKPSEGDINKWTYKFEDLPKYANGVEIDYTVVEDLGDSKQANHTLVSVDGYDITNTYSPDKTSVEVLKAWDDDNDRDGMRPVSIVVTLCANGVATSSTITLNAANHWQGVFTDLDEVDGDGNLIEYTVSELDVPEGYAVEISGDMAKGFVVTNTHEPEMTEVAAVKEWNDGDDQDGIRPDSVTFDLYAKTPSMVEAAKVGSRTVSEESGWSVTWADLHAYYKGEEITYTVEEAGVPEGYTSTVDGFTITNTHIPATIDIPVIKRWNDACHTESSTFEHPDVTIYLLQRIGEGEFERVKGVEGNDISITLGEGRLSGVFTGLPVHSAGVPIEYFVEEIAVAGYDSIVRGSMEAGFSITNARQHTSVSIVKVWSDADNQDGLRPGEVTVTLLANGQKTDDSITLKEGDDGSWKGTFADLHIYDTDGQLIEYTVEELPVAGYTTSIDGDMAQGYTITNTHDIEIYEAVSVTKVWNDNNNQSGKRPEAIDVSLICSEDGQQVEVESATLTSENGWTYTWSNLPVYANGEKIDYGIVEDEAVLDEYVVTYSGNIEEGFVVTNTLDESVPDTGEESEDPLLPSTGDENLGLIGALAILAAVAAGAIVIALSKGHRLDQALRRR